MIAHRFILSLAAAALFLPLACGAAKPEAEKHIDVARQERFEDQAAAIRQEMKTGGRFEFLTAAERGGVEKQLDTIAAILEAHSGAKLDDDAQLDVYAAQETANSILTQKDGRRLICEYTAPTGSNRKVKQCMTFAERTRAHKESQNTMRDNLHKNAPDMRGPNG
ncbi:hypothetical protein DFR29_104217 [Tahibacter aquaticus]|uniref:Uncharacterized protein n=1 Tax=Tahibacter aquaticus TaxID=520092 RepID=A0A4R6Z2T4_9GAMM|nr:hypothetical protein [Tahibacter aquaticus]TDR45789.1 hypothetical protein DFR29_104217 [Tahibacter aquaticus]